MAKIVLTTSSSGAGHIKLMRLADRVIAVQHRLVWGAVPAAADGATFAAERRRMATEPGADWAYWLECENGEKRGEIGVEDQAVTEAPNPHWEDLVDFISAFEVIELWVDPLPNAQLILVQLLSWLSDQPTVLDRLTLVHARSPLGERGTGRFDDPRHAVGERHVTSALRVWEAYTSPTPEPWVGLASEAFDELPHLHAVVLSMLRELPDAKTGLGFTEALILGLMSGREARPFDLFPGHRKPNQSTVFNYWETGLLIDRLSESAEPAIAGLAVRPFTLAMHDDEERFAAYREDCLRLTSFGERLVRGESDFGARFPGSRWWGGVRLSRENLWRWEPHSRALVRPAS